MKLILFYCCIMFSPTTWATTFATIGDFGVANSAEQNVANLVDSWNPEFVVTLGDNDYTGGNYEQSVRPYYGSYISSTCSNNRFFPSFGNHDSTSAYNSIFPCTGKQYRVKKGDVEFFTINSDVSSPSSSARAWLQNALADSTAAWKVVFFHHAAYSSGNHGSASKMQLPYAEWGADIVMAGHDHHYERIERNGIWYFVNGLGGRGRYSVGSPITGSKVLYNSNWGAMRVDTTSTTFRVQFVNISGTVIDDYTIQKGSSNNPPVAEFSSNKNGLSVSFTDNSTDSNGSIVSRSWQFGDGSTSTQTNPNHTYSAAGTYTVKLTVKDNDGISDSITKNITVSDSSSSNELENGVPLTGLAANKGADTYYTMEVPAGATDLLFNISGGSGDADLYVRFGSQPTSTTYDCRPYKNGNVESCAINSVQAGTYHIMLSAYANYSGVTLKGSYTSTSGNTPPKADFSVTQSSLTASFTDKSSDTDGQISSWSWDFGDGATSTSASPSHTYVSAGTYTVKLTVTDNKGASNSKTQNITVSDSSDPNALQNGVPKTGLSGNSGSNVFYTMQVPQGATNLVFNITGGSGDADLYVRFGSKPTTNSYDCRPYRNGNNETCTINSVQAGTYHIMLRGYNSYSGVTLKGSYN